MLYRRIFSWTKNPGKPISYPDFTLFFQIGFSFHNCYWVFNLVITFTSLVILGKLCSSFHSLPWSCFLLLKTYQELSLKIVKRLLCESSTVSHILWLFNKYYILISSQWVPFKKIFIKFSLIFCFAHNCHSGLPEVPNRPSCFYFSGFLPLHTSQ